MVLSIEDCNGVGFFMALISSACGGVWEEVLGGVVWLPFCFSSEFNRVDSGEDWAFSSPWEKEPSLGFGVKSEFIRLKMPNLSIIFTSFK